MQFVIYSQPKLKKIKEKGKKRRRRRSVKIIKNKELKLAQSQDMIVSLNIIFAHILIEFAKGL